MADKKITQLTNITGANLVDADEFVVVDISADETKAITLGELKEAFDSGSGFVRITGDTMTGDLGFGDNDKAIFGAGSDLQIYHDGTNSYISDQGTGNLKILGTSMNIQSAAGENYIEAVNNAHVKLFYNAAEKLATTSTGIDVTGTVTADGLTVDGDGQINQTAGNASTLTFTSNGQASRYSRIKVDTDRSLILTAGVGAVNETPDIKLQTGTSTGEKDRLLIDGATGDISFYEDTGTTPKFFWDASAESLGLGATSFAGETLRMERSGDMILGLFSGAANGTYLNMGTTANRDIGQISYTQSTNHMTFRTNDAERMRIDSSGNVGIGTSSPSAPLHVAGDARIGAGTGDASLMGMVASGDNFKITTSSGIGTVSFDRNVGIGTSSPSQVLHVESSSVGVTRVSVTNTGNAAAGAGVQFITKNGATQVSNATLRTDNAGNFSIFTGTTGEAERMRIDSSGNLLVSKSSSSFSTVGSEFGSALNSEGWVSFLTSNNTSANVGGTIALNRKSTDGAIARFYKDGTTVGSIGTWGGDPAFMAGNNWGLKLYDQSGNDIVHPINTSGNTYDGNINLGYSASRFKDLYLSGGVYLGGTGAANKLDDYEEGTFGASLDGASGGSITLKTASNTLSYIKIGSLVHIQGRIDVDSVSSPTGYIKLSLPFGAANPAEGSGESVGSVFVFGLASAVTTGFTIRCDKATSNAYIEAYDGTTNQVDATDVQANTGFRIGFSYRTNA